MLLSDRFSGASVAWKSLGSLGYIEGTVPLVSISLYSRRWLDHVAGTAAKRKSLED